jgi:hypothetical protein
MEYRNARIYLFLGWGCLALGKGIHGLLGTIRAVTGSDIQVGFIMDILFNRDPSPFAGLSLAVVSDFLTHAAHRQ